MSRKLNKRYNEKTKGLNPLVFSLINYHIILTYAIIFLCTKQINETNSCMKYRQKFITISKGVKDIMKRRTAREKALQALFQIDVSNTDPSSAIEHVLEGETGDEYLTRLVLGVVEQKENIDQLIKANLEKWSLDRLATVDRNLLRIAVFELKFSGSEVPENVILDEAIEIAKIYGDDQSSRFINGVLSKVK